MRWFCLLFIGLMGCLAHSPALQAPAQSRALVATVVATDASRAVGLAPPALASRIEAAVVDRGFEVVSLDPQVALDTFRELRTPALRHGFLTDAAAPGALVVFVEAAARRFGEIGGRYRWAVDLRIWVAPQGMPEAAVQVEFTAPVYLEHYHQKAEAALEAASPAIERQLAVLLDESIGSL